MLCTLLITSFEKVSNKNVIKEDLGSFTKLI